MAYNEKHGGYPYLLSEADPTDTDVQATSDFLQATTFAEQQAWADARTRQFNLGRQVFRMVVDRPGDDGHAVIITSEFSSGIVPPAIARARIIRDMVNPDATLILQPSTTYAQPNMNYSHSERTELRRGLLAPLIGRIMVALESAGNPDRTTVFGSSQGGAVALGFGADPRTPTSGIAVIEPPNVTPRNRFGLTMDFIGCGQGLRDVIVANYEDPSSSFAQDTLSSISRATPLESALDFVQWDNQAMVGVMQRGSAWWQTGAILKRGGSVAHAWGTDDKVSTVEDNRDIAELFEDHRRYQSFELAGACHGVTSAFALCGALARVAWRLQNN